MNLLDRTVGKWLSKAFPSLSSGGVLTTVGSRWFGAFSGSLFTETEPGGWQRNEEPIQATLSNPTLYACITLIASDMAKLRPMVVEQDEDRIWTENDDTPWEAVLERPNDYQTWPQYMEWYMRSKLVFGNAYVLKRRDQRGVVNALYVLDPCRVWPYVAPDHSVFYSLSPDFMDPAQLDFAMMVPARELIHDVMVPLFHPLCGTSPIYAAGFPAMQGLNIRTASDTFFKNGSRPGGILLVPGMLTQPQVDEMKANWKLNFAGRKQGDLAVLTGGMTYQAMAQTARDASLIEQLHMTDEDICKCFHMPRYKVQVGPDPSYANIEALNRNYYTDCLQGLITQFQILHTQGLELDQVPGKTYALELDLDDLLMMDAKTRAEVAEIGVRAGLSYNEARFGFWDRGPVDGGDSPLAQQQNYSLAALAKRDASADPFASVRETFTGPAPTTAPAPVKALDVAALPSLIAKKLGELAA